MLVNAKQKNIHLSASKAKLICDLIKGKKVIDAQIILTNLDKKGSNIIGKILKSAIANATNNFSLDINTLSVKNAVADQGKTIKRTLPRAKGSANLIRKRHCHITIILTDEPITKKMPAYLKNKLKTKQQKTNSEVINTIVNDTMEGEIK